MRQHTRLASALLLCVPLCLLTAPASRAVVLDGAYSIDFSGAQSLWPLEDIDICEQEFVDGVSVEVCLDFSFVSNGAGGVNGTGMITVEISGGGLDAMATLSGVIQGKSKGSDTKGVKHSISFKLAGSIVIQLQSFDMRVSGKLGTIISPGGMATTTGTAGVSVKGVGSAKAPLEPPLMMQLPSGDWSAVLDVTPDAENKVLSGTLDLMLPGGNVQIPISGKYNAKKDESSLKAKGDKADPDASGISFSLKGVRSGGPAELAGEAKAKVQGLKLGGPVSAAP